MRIRPLILLVACASLLVLPGNAAEQAPAQAPREPAPQQTAPRQPAPQTPPAQKPEPPPPKETEPEELPPNERGSADNNITFPVDI